MIVVLTTLQ